MNKIKSLLIVAGASTLLLSSCAKDTSNTTGWEYNTEDNGGFENPDYMGQETGPGLVLIQGGTFSMGRKEQDVMYDWNNFPRRVTVPSFYLDQWEVRNIDYREYLYWLGRVFIDYPEVYSAALPDTLVWRKRLGYNRPYVDYYFRHPSYKNYPVVGVNWLQANDYCAWRTDRVNENIMIREGLLEMDPVQQSGEENFNTEAYLAGQYEGVVKNQMPDLNPNADFRKVRMEDGFLLPRFRLPTEAEWEFAAYALIGNMMAEERVFSQKIYPWNGHYIRVDDRSGFDSDDVGKIRANAVRGRGDYMGVAGALNDANAPTAPVDFYWPNPYGVYAMAGNVNEWVLDIYRDLSYEDMDEFRPFRGNVFQTQDRDEEGLIAEKDTLGRIKYHDVTDWESFDRRNYNTADNINYEDGNFESSTEYALEEGDKDNKHSTRMYWQGNKSQQGQKRDQATDKVDSYRGRQDQQSLVNNRIRVIKGGGWADRAYWMSPGNRRFWPEEMGRDDIGFRCAMDRLGGPVSEE